MLKLNRKELIKKFDLQITQLKECSDLYDQGKEYYATNMALIFRKLFHNTRNQKSLYKILDENHYFLTNCHPFSPHNLLGSSCLTIDLIGSDNGGEHKILPILEYQDNMMMCSFDDWWNEIVMKDQSGNLFTRKDIVLHVADQEAAHVDENIDEKFYEMANGNNYIMKGVIINNGHETLMELKNNPFYVSIRSICFEYLETLSLVRNNYTLEKTDFVLNLINLNDAGYSRDFTTDVKKYIDENLKGMYDSIICETRKVYKMKIVGRGNINYFSI